MQRELEVAIAAAKTGGAIVAKYYRGDYQVHEKAPDNPLTVADTEADAAIKKACLGAFPDDGWLSEETKDSPERLKKSRVWIVDPLDGTKEFTQHIPEFCVCVALVVDGVVQVGVSYNPATDSWAAVTPRRRMASPTGRCTPATAEELTKVPRPARVSMSPSSPSERRDSRMSGRPTPYRLARARSDGSCSPGRRRPETMSSAIASLMRRGLGASNRPPPLDSPGIVHERSDW